MPGPYIELSFWQVVLAAVLILINGGISLALQLRLQWQLFLAATRLVIQLLLVGWILEWVFSVERWYVVLTLMFAMTVTAGVAAVGRSERVYRGMVLNSVISMVASSWSIAAVGLLVVVRVDPWYLPQYTIPILGMILGNSLNGVTLGLDRLSKELIDRRDGVESLLALGATRWEAVREPVREAIRTGMIPVINAMTVAGIVSLPGMMTGQLLAGVEPLQAVQYQIVIFFLIASATALGTVTVVLLSYRRLFNSQHQFEHWRIRKRR